MSNRYDIKNGMFVDLHNGQYMNFDAVLARMNEMNNSLSAVDIGRAKYELSCGGDPVPAYKPRTKRNDQLNKEHKL